MTDRTQELLSELVEAIKGKEEPTIDERIANAQTPAELENIFREQEAQARQEAQPEPTEVEPIETWKAYEKRQAAFEEGLTETDDIRGYMADNIEEVAALGRAERELQSPEDEEALEAIANAETLEELNEVTRTEDTELMGQDWLEHRWDNIEGDDS